MEKIEEMKLEEMYAVSEQNVCAIAGANSETAVYICQKLLNDRGDNYHFFLCWHEHNDRIVHCFKGEPNVTICQHDLTQEFQAEQFIQEIFGLYGKIDVLINCIGKNYAAENGDITEQVWDDVIGVNLKPAFFLGKYYYQYNREKKKGCIVHFSSTAGIRAVPTSPHYITAKAGLIALTEYFARIMAPDVRVNAIAPGYIQTAKHAQGSYDLIREKIPMKRMASMEEIYDTVMYLINCEYITGQTIVIDGGMIL